MNRRDFLSYLGLGSATLLIDPASILPAPTTVQAVEVFEEYPKLYFTGFKASQTSTLLAGQFLWCVDWIARDGTVGMTPWFCAATIALHDLRENPSTARSLVRSRIQNGTLSVVRMMDEIVADAKRGVVQTGKYHQIPNPDFNPDLPATNPYDDDYEVWNPKTVSGPPVIQEIKSMQFRPFDASEEDAWDFERQAALACAAWKI